MSDFEPQLPNLETFSKAAELNSFTAAAEALGITQAAVSQRVQALERALGVALFERKGGRVVLSPPGQCLYTYAQRILALHREAIEELTGRRTPIAGELLLASSTIPGEHLLPGALAIFRRQYPEIRVRVTVLDSTAVLSDVEHGRVHLGLVGRKGDHPHLHFRAFATDELLVVVPPQHPWKKKGHVALRQLAEQPLILREPGSGSRWCLEQALAGLGASMADFKVTMEFGSNESIKEAVLQGMGVAVLSELAVRKEIEAGQLHAVRIESLPLERTIYVVWDERRVLPQPARIFLQFLEPCPGTATLS